MQNLGNFGFNHRLFNGHKIKCVKKLHMLKSYQAEFGICKKKLQRLYIIFSIWYQVWIVSIFFTFFAFWPCQQMQNSVFLSPSNNCFHNKAWKFRWPRRPQKCNWCAKNPLLTLWKCNRTWPWRPIIFGQVERHTPKTAPLLTIKKGLATPKSRPRNKGQTF